MYPNFLYQANLKSFLKDDAQCVLVVLSKLEFNRRSFFNELSAWIKAEEVFNLELDSDEPLASLIQKVTDRLFLPVRSVDVDIEEQLASQIRLLKKMKRQIVLRIEEAQARPLKDLFILFKLTQIDREDPAKPIKLILIGNLGLEKKLMQLDIRIPYQTLKLEDTVNTTQKAESKKGVQFKFSLNAIGQQMFQLVCRHAVRSISILLLIGVGLFLWQFQFLFKPTFFELDKMTESEPIKNPPGLKKLNSETPLHSEPKKILEVLPSPKTSL